MMAEEILVTGSSRGIGRAIAIRLARDGFDVVLHCVQRRDAADFAADEVRQLGRNARVLQFDIADRETARKALAGDIDEHGAYYGVVLNAGVTRDAAFPMLEGEDWDGVIRTNLDGFFNVLKPCVTPMIRAHRDGRIVTIASISGITGNRGQVNYSASKGGIIAATKSLAIELAKRRITVNCVAPGLIETEMTEGVSTDILKTLIPQRRMGTPEEVAAVVSFLCTPDASYVTRQVIGVNGGMH